MKKSSGEGLAAVAIIVAFGMGLCVGAAITTFSLVIGL